MERIGVIIVAGGNGSRMGTSRPKQFMLLNGQPILAHTINRFASALPGAEIVVVLPEAYTEFWKNLAARFEIAQHRTVTGGVTRFDSVRSGLAACTAATELIAIHDGVRPLVSEELICRTAEVAKKHGAAVPVVELADSFRMTDGATSHIIDRSLLRAVQTPQIFHADLLHCAYQAEFCNAFTDDASVVEQSGAPIFLCEGERRNIKITTPEDLLLAEAILESEQCEPENND